MIWTWQYHQREEEERGEVAIYKNWSVIVLRTNQDIICEFSRRVVLSSQYLLTWQADKFVPRNTDQSNKGSICQMKKESVNRRCQGIMPFSHQCNVRSSDLPTLDWDIFWSGWTWLTIDGHMDSKTWPPQCASRWIIRITGPSRCVGLVIHEQRLKQTPQRFLHHSMHTNGYLGKQPLHLRIRMVT